jgi:2'-5' RNA ligase
MANQHASQPHQVFSPDIWIPHITLAFKDLTPEKLACSMDKFIGRDFDWDIQIDNFAVVCQEENRVGELVKVYDFEEA